MKLIVLTFALLLISEVFARRPVITDDEPTTAAPKKTTTIARTVFTTKGTTVITTQRITRKPKFVSTTTQSSQVASLSREVLKKLILDFINLKYRELYLSRVYCNYELSEKQLQNYEMCAQKEFQKNDWFKRCEPKVYGKKWTYKTKRFMHCNKPSEVQKRWIDCIRGERDRNKYEIVNQGSSNNNVHIVRSHKRSKRSTAIHINLNSSEDWNKVSMETKKKIFEIMRQRYNKLKLEVECMENALGMNA